ncbi:Peptidoglycan-N-acetylglucosamine deacetylase [Sporomusa carbonis]|uniref:polysaccharide deacetylase family protein n=1 Tax=Sporomusa carbonis TaxID=3076075 RepID=UPI003A64ABAF
MRQWFFFLCCVLPLLLLAQNQVNLELWYKNHIVKSVTTTHKVVALTFDDGPHYKTTPKILDVLKEKQVRATFFILGVNAKNSPQILARELADGHELGNHGYSHKHLTEMTKENVEQEMSRTEEIIMALAPKPVIFRPPGGFFDKKVLETAEEKGYTTVLWTIDPHDWARPPMQKVVNEVLDNIKPGSIILMHDGQYPLPTPEAIVYVIDNLRQQGYEFVTVSELLQYSEFEKVRHSYNIYNW